MFGISWDQVSGQIRALLIGLGGFAVGKGWVSNETMIAIVGVAMAVFGALWTAKANTPTDIVKSAERIPDVAKVEMKDTPLGEKIVRETGVKVVKSIVDGVLRK